MQVLYASDIHISHGHFRRLLNAAKNIKAGAIIIGGDIIPVKKRNFDELIQGQISWVKETLIPAIEEFRRKSPEIAVFLDFGNDDAAAARSVAEEAAGRDFQLIHGKVVALDERTALAACMFVPPTPFKLKDWEKKDTSDHSGLDIDAESQGYLTSSGTATPIDLNETDETIEQNLEALSEELKSSQWKSKDFIFISHSPPMCTKLDRLRDGRHVGSLAIRHFIKQWGRDGRLKCSLHGHIHEGYETGSVRDKIAKVPCFNLGQSVRDLRALLFDSGDVWGTSRLIIAEEDRITEFPIK